MQLVFGTHQQETCSSSLCAILWSAWELNSLVAAPPPRTRQRRMTRPLTIRNLTHYSCQFCRVRHSPSDIEGARFVMPILASDQLVPIEGAHERPNRQRNAFHALTLSLPDGLPRFSDPAYLFFYRAAKVHLGDGYRNLVSLPRVPQKRFETSNAFATHTDGLYVDETSLARPECRRIKVHPVVQISIAGRIVVHSNHIRRTGVVGEPQHVSFADSLRQHECKHWMMPRDAAAEKVERQPSPHVQLVTDQFHTFRACPA
jgi:hypothetical protein